MKLKFKRQAYQAKAVNAVAKCFNGQQRNDLLRYRIAPGYPDSNYKCDSFVFLDSPEALTSVFKNGRI